MNDFICASKKEQCSQEFFVFVGITVKLYRFFYLIAKKLVEKLRRYMNGRDVIDIGFQTKLGIKG
jgi:hypothetical protein